MDNWILLTILYAFFVSLDEVFKKKATKKNSVYEVLACFTTIALVLSFFITEDKFDIDYSFLPAIFLKSSIVVVAWLLSLKALEGLQLSVYSIIKTSRIVFSIILSILFLNEKLNPFSALGIIITITGLVIVGRTSTKEQNKKKSYKLIILFLISCLCSSISAIIDKKILFHISSGQLQFWFLLFLTLFYWAIIFIKKPKINYKNLRKNYWIVLVAIGLVVGDRFLFMANKDPSSQVIVMTILKQLSVIISILLGKLVFKEKNITKKLLYTLLILIGVIMTILFS